ncbi:hypothetical protein D9M71_705170 [compost metagenome]
MKVQDRAAATRVDLSEAPGDVDGVMVVNFHQGFIELLLDLRRKHYVPLQCEARQCASRCGRSLGGRFFGGGQQFRP